MGQLTTLLGVLGGCAAVFYAVGFTTVQSYVYKYPLDGMFWFTSEFYRDAGAKFLLEFVRTPLVAWYVFFPYLFALYQLVPHEDMLQLRAAEGRPALVSQWTRVVMLGVVLAITYVVALGFDEVLGTGPGSDVIDFLFVRIGDGDTWLTAQSLAFFTLTAPVVIVSASFLWRFRSCLTTNGGANRRIYELMLVGYVVFLAVLPISYGFHLYDWRIVPVRDSAALAARLGGAECAPGEQMAWLLGEFGGKYLFLTKTSTLAPGVLEAVAANDIKHLLLEPSQSVSLKAHLARHSDPVAQESGIRGFRNELPEGAK